MACSLLPVPDYTSFAFQLRLQIKPPNRMIDIAIPENSSVFMHSLSHPKVTQPLLFLSNSLTSSTTITFILSRSQNPASSASIIPLASGGSNAQQNLPHAPSSWKDMVAMASYVSSTLPASSIGLDFASCCRHDRVCESGAASPQISAIMHMHCS